MRSVRQQAQARAGRAASGERHTDAGRATGVLGTGAGRATWARCWPTGCALGALSLFLVRFDSVLFLSHFWTLFVKPVHEHCSSQKFSKFFLN